MKIIWTNPKDKDSTVVKKVVRHYEESFAIYTKETSWYARLKGNRLEINGGGLLFGYIDLTEKELNKLKKMKELEE